MITEWSYAAGCWLFLRLMGVSYLAAFLSLAAQVRALAGRHGIMPVTEVLAERKRLHRSTYILEFPTFFWWRSTDATLLGVCIAGGVLSLMLMIGFAPIPVLCLLWILYLSLFNAIPLFLSFQWDVLLLEAGFLSIFAAPPGLLPLGPTAYHPPVIAVLLLWWLLFRLMFFSGITKLRSSDPAWRNLTALVYHYETQPLPTPLSWFTHQLPKWFHRLCTFLTLVIESALPFAIFAPPPWRYFAAAGFATLMLSIILTGNYCFFNLLMLALCVVLIDDRGVGLPQATAPASPNAALIIVGILILLLSLDRLTRLFSAQHKSLWPLQRVAAACERFRLVNFYGLFTVMTTERNEIILEGSRDGETWLEYELRWKPGNVRRMPQWVIPHQPRIDWQTWFAALGEYRHNGWLLVLMLRLLEGDKELLRFFRRNPFPDRPPLYVRAMLYGYRFTNIAERRASGAWWKRERRWLYSPVLSLKGIEYHLMPPKDWS